MRVVQVERPLVLDDAVVAKVRDRTVRAAPKWTDRLAWLIRIVPALVPGMLMLGIGLRGAGRPVLSWDEVATMDPASSTTSPPT